MQPLPEPNQADDEFADHDNVAGRGRAFYEAHLRQRLEPEHDGQAIALHLDTGDYTVASSIGNAMRAIRAKHPNGPLFLRRIGPEPEEGLASRLLLSQSRGRRK